MQNDQTLHECFKTPPQNRKRRCHERRLGKRRVDASGGESEFPSPPPRNLLSEFLSVSFLHSSPENLKQ